MWRYKHKQHRHRRSQKIFHWSAKSTFCLPISGCWQYNANGRSHKALPFLHHQENYPCYDNSPKNAFGWHQGFFSHCIKVRDLLQSAVIASLHYLPQMSSTVTCGLNAYFRNLKWNFVAMLLLRNEGQFWNYPHPSFATCPCRKCSGHEWTSSSKLYDTTTVNLAHVQYEGHIRKWNRHCKN